MLIYLQMPSQIRLCIYKIEKTYIIYLQIYFQTKGFLLFSLMKVCTEIERLWWVDNKINLSEN